MIYITLLWCCMWFMLLIEIFSWYVKLCILTKWRESITNTICVMAGWHNIRTFFHSLLSYSYPNPFVIFIYRGADKSLVRPGRKQAAATKLWFVQATQKKKKSEVCPSNQVSTAAMTSTSDEKWWPFNCFFSRVGLRTYQHPCNKSAAIMLCYVSSCVQCWAVSSPQSIPHREHSHLLIFLQPEFILYREHTTFWHRLPRQP